MKIHEDEFYQQLATELLTKLEIYLMTFPCMQSFERVPFENEKDYDNFVADYSIVLKHEEHGELKVFATLHNSLDLHMVSDRGDSIIPKEKWLLDKK